MGFFSNLLKDLLYEHIDYNRNLDYAMMKVIYLIAFGAIWIIIFLLSIILLRLLNYFIQKKVQSHSIKKISFWLTLILLDMLVFLISIISIIIPSLFYGIDRISLGLCLLFTLSLALIFFYLSMSQAKHFLKGKPTAPTSYLRMPSELPDKNKSNRKKTKIWIVISGFLFVYLSCAIPLALENLCFASWAPMGFDFFGHLISTKLYREAILDPICPPGPPCHVYATLSGDASTSFFLNIHTSIDTPEVNILYDTKEHYETFHSLRYNSPSTYWAFDFEWTGARNVHTAHINDLIPDTMYYFEIYYKGQLQYSNMYKTLPAPDHQKNIILAVGGDVGSNEIAQKMTGNLEALDPDVIIIGGDGAYDNGMRSCYYNYDSFLNMFESLNKKLNKIVPIILGIGNHELGIHSMSNVNVEISDSKGPLYFLFFPQHLANENASGSITDIPSPGNRRTYFSQILRNTLHTALDSGYISSFNGTQSDWLRNISDKYSALPKFAHYHAPTICSCYLKDDTPDYQINLAYESWSSIFEENYFEAAFENHFHLFKKSFPIRDKKVDSEGVLYLGEGKWGAYGNHCLDYPEVVNQTGLIEVASDQFHIWILNLTATSWEYYPINENGEVFYNKTSKTYF